MTTYNTVLKNDNNNSIRKIKGVLIAMMKKKRIKKHHNHLGTVKQQELDYVRFKLDAIKFLL